MKILISDRATLRPLVLPDGVEAVPFDEAKPIPPEHHDAQAVVMWGTFQDDPAEYLADLTDLRWVQSFRAGPDELVRAGLPDDVVITRGLHFHDRPVAEHAMALALAHIRHLPEALAAQEGHVWAARDLGGLRRLNTSDRLSTLLGAKVTVWGFGAIGQEVAKLAAAFGADVTGIARHAGERAGFPVATDDDIPRVFADTDVLVMVLPDSADTRDALDAKRLAMLPRRAIVVNVGRGSTVDEDALVAALTAGTLGAAALDVAKTEPLPADSPLWDAPNLLITPHAAGGGPVGAEAFIERNLRHLLAGEELEGVMPR